MKAHSAKLIAISALALSAGYNLPALAQLQITCAQRFFIGAHDACSTGTLQVDPDGGTALVGCLVSSASPAPGRCILSTLGTGPTKSIVVKFQKTSINISGAGTQVKVDNFLMSPVGTVATGTQFTFTPTEVKNTVTLDIGGTAYFSNNQTIGVYTGTLSITANPL